MKPMDPIRELLAKAKEESNDQEEPLNSEDLKKYIAWYATFTEMPENECDYLLDALDEVSERGLSIHELETKSEEALREIDAAINALTVFRQKQVDQLHDEYQSDTAWLWEPPSKEEIAKALIALEKSARTKQRKREERHLTEYRDIVWDDKLTFAVKYLSKRYASKGGRPREYDRESVTKQIDEWEEVFRVTREKFKKEVASTPKRQRPATRDVLARRHASSIHTGLREDPRIKSRSLNLGTYLRELITSRKKDRTIAREFVAFLDNIAPDYIRKLDAK